jgi:Fic family protein
MSGRQKMNEVRYIVKNEFKYDGKIYKIGEEWEPQGFKTDELIINQEELITVDHVGVDTRAKRQKRVKERRQKADRREIAIAIYAMRETEPPTTWKKITEYFGISESTARRYYEREKEKHDAKNKPSRASKSRRSKASSAK